MYLRKKDMKESVWEWVEKKKKKKKKNLSKTLRFLEKECANIATEKFH